MRKYDSYNVGALDIVVIRAIVTTALLFMVLLIFDRGLFRIRLRDIWCFLGTGLCSIVFFNFCYFKAITLTSMSMAAVLLYTAPAMVIIMSFVFFHEPLNRNKMIAFIMTFIGCVCVTGVWKEKMNLDGKAIVIGLGAGFGYALYSIFSRCALERNYHPFTISFYTFLFAAIGLLPFVHLREDIYICTNNQGMLWFTLCFGVISTVLPYILYTQGLKHTENGTASILASVEPLVATVFGILLFGEQMTMSGTAGMIFILGGILVCNWRVQETK